MKLGLYNAILHDRSLEEAISFVSSVGLTGLELNSGGFLPTKHIPTFDDILVSDTARDDFLGVFEGTGVGIAGLNANGNPLHPNRAIAAGATEVMGLTEQDYGSLDFSVRDPEGVLWSFGTYRGAQGSERADA